MPNLSPEHEILKLLLCYYAQVTDLALFFGDVKNRLYSLKPCSEIQPHLGWAIKVTEVNHQDWQLGLIVPNCLLRV